MKKHLLLPCGIAAIMLLTGCAEPEDTTIDDTTISDVMADAATSTMNGATSIIEEPFKDVGLKRDGIPQVLTGLTKNPYIMPGAPLCENLNYEIVALDDVLGTDMGSKGRDGKFSYTEQKLNDAQDKMSRMLRDEMRTIPFRGVVRHISGAELHARKVAEAYDAGRLRRAYLKGLAQSYHCADKKKP